MMDALRRLAAHLRWADQRVLAALRRTAAPPARARELYLHVLGAEEVWLARIEGRPPLAAVWPELSLEDAGALAARTHDALDRLIAGLDAAGLAREVAYTNSAGQAFRTPVGEILLHVCLHGVNHRGQISQLLRQAGADPVPTDYIEFVRGVPAATRQPAGRLEAIWVKRVRRGPMDPVAEAELKAGQGIVGNADQGGKRQVTLLEREVWEALMREVGATADPSARRANLLVSGLRLRDTRGRVLRIGGTPVRIWGETRPCDLLEETAAGLREAMKRDWGGGAFGEVLEDGAIRVGDPVGWDDGPTTKEPA
jgi:uncharacterized damage-inducible protein DinB/MOSC domain-containing protein YiiM